MSDMVATMESIQEMRADCLNLLDMEKQLSPNDIPSFSLVRNQLLTAFNDIENIIKPSVLSTKVTHSLNQVSLEFSTANISENRFAMSFDYDATIMNIEGFSEGLFADFNTSPVDPNNFGINEVWLEFTRYLIRRTQAIQETVDIFAQNQA